MIFVKTYVVSQVTVLENPLVKFLKCLLQRIQVSCVSDGLPLDMTLWRTEEKVLCPLSIQSNLEFDACYTLFGILDLQLWYRRSAVYSGYQ
jgi:hypothetical protein